MKVLKRSTEGVRKAARAARRMKGQLSKNLTDAQKKEYKKDIKEAFKDAKTDLDKIVTQINSLEKPGQIVLTSANADYTRQNILHI